MQKQEKEPGFIFLNDERIQQLKDLGLEPKIKRMTCMPRGFQEVFMEKLKETKVTPLTFIVEKNNDDWN
jgi:hypothetical protein